MSILSDDWDEAMDLIHDRADEHGVNNPAWFARESKNPQWLEERMAEVERENAERRENELSRRKERIDAGLCERDGCNQQRMDGGTECRMHFLRGQYQELR